MKELYINKFTKRNAFINMYMVEISRVSCWFISKSDIYIKNFNKKEWYLVCWLVCIYNTGGPRLTLKIRSYARRNLHKHPRVCLTPWWRAKNFQITTIQYGVQPVKKQRRVPHIALLDDDVLYYGRWCRNHETQHTTVYSKLSK